MPDGEKTDDLKSLLAETFDAVERQQQPDSTPEVKPEATPEAAPVEEPKSAETARPRDATGKFLPKDAAPKEETPPAPEPVSTSEAKPAEETTASATSAAAGDLPTHWSAADKELFGKLPQEMRSDVVERFKRMEAGFTPKLQKLAQIEKDYGEAVDLLNPHLETLRQNGGVATWIKNMGQIEQTLISARIAAQSQRTDPQALAATDNGARLVAGLIQGFNIDPANVARFLSNAVAQQQQQLAPQPNGNGYAVDPVLAQEVSSIKQQLEGWQQRDMQTRQAQAQSQIERFAGETNPDGSLKHPFFSELESDITQLAGIERSQGRDIDLPALYERAVWANTSTRDQLLASQRQADAKRAADEAKAKAEAAKKASSSVTGSPQPGQMQEAASTARNLRASILAAEEALQ